MIIFVGTIELDSERQADMIAKSITDVVLRNDNFSTKALGVNDKLLKMCREAKLDFITYKQH